jgi:hypothetical protein
MNKNFTHRKYYHWQVIPVLDAIKAAFVGCSKIGLVLELQNIFATYVHNAFHWRWTGGNKAVKWHGVLF